MLIAKNDEVKRSRIWKIVMSVSSVLIVVIAVYLLTKMFTANPLEGSWESEDGSFAIGIGPDGLMTVRLIDVSGEGDVDVKMFYTLDKDAKTITIKEDAAEFEKTAEESGGAYTRESLENELSRIITTFDYSIDSRRLTLTEREYGEQLTFEKK